VTLDDGGCVDASSSDDDADTGVADVVGRCIESCCWPDLSGASKVVLVIMRFYASLWKVYAFSRPK
jgi:hypothetical protein